MLPARSRWIAILSGSNRMARPQLLHVVRDRLGGLLVDDAVAGGAVEALGDQAHVAEHVEPAGAEHVHDAIARPARRIAVHMLGPDPGIAHLLGDQLGMLDRDAEEDGLGVRRVALIGRDGLDDEGGLGRLFGDVLLVPVAGEGPDLLVVEARGEPERPHRRQVPPLTSSWIDGPQCRWWNCVPSALPSRRAGVAVSPSTRARGKAFRMSSHVLARAWCASSTITM